MKTIRHLFALALLSIGLLIVTNAYATPPIGNGNTIEYADSSQALGRGFDIALGDLDGDGTLDAFVARHLAANAVYTNNGSGIFTDSTQELGPDATQGVALGDLDGDGDLDAFTAQEDRVCGANSRANRVYINQGGIQAGTEGSFTDSGQCLGSVSGFSSRDVKLGDVDGDGDLDAVVANSNGANNVWYNDGSATFTLNQGLGSSASYGVDLGDVDGDGDLDAVFANYGQANTVWINTNGTFASGQALGTSNSNEVALGDVDNDGDLDMFVANYGQANRVWTNSGGTFTDSTQTLGTANSSDAKLGDVDNRHYTD